MKFIRFLAGDQPSPDAGETIPGADYLGVVEDAAIPERKIEMATPSVVAAPVQPAATSTINWAQILGPLASFAAWFGLALDPETLVKVVIGVQSTISLYTLVKNTWFSPRVLAPSAVALKTIK